ncbi:U11/U12 small nuclear ribonucleoprotein 65 kDa protein isoform X1 [Vigna radiata var. radiata]|uniref:U11/U12 small nuclear ribonucleoprotein 65 kDa protein isoform X1 n=1 Tax=Vigna radiata var. radiata TaxID=3916 RepID=A0A1S3TBW7_VIGRR|nr:U11/U12 small nuclear ribonucleoprotein 65 kDa protein isoform X1 [Vigna radiata var. radiata]
MAYDSSPHGRVHQFVLEGTESKPLDTESAEPVTLLIKHLPEAIPHDTLSRIFANFGAFSVRPCSSVRLKNCAFADFKNEMVASQAQHQLHGLRFLGKVLSAERASKLTGNGENSSGDQLGKDSKTSMLKNANVGKPVDGDTKSRGLPIPEPIADRLGVNYPFPPHLEYAYPPPDGNILTNIVNALIAVPRFYTQVLHLMNKMNIPAPFRMALPTPPLPPEVPAPPPPTVTINPQSAYLSSDESEMESSDEECDASTKKSGQKRARREAIVGPAIDKGVAHESVGVKPATLVPKEIPMIKKNHVLKINIVPKATLSKHRDDETTQELQEPEKDVPDPSKFLTPDELEKGKLPPEEILSLPMFKNYTAGNPAPVLYVKNLAKDVIVDDFYYIFGSLFGSVEAAKSGLQVKLMQEGRMRGQAFLTFPSVELAHLALNRVNGYVLKGKPMIIQFGRNPAAAKA